MKPRNSGRTFRLLSRGEQRAGAVSPSSHGLALFLSCILLGGCGGQSGEKKSAAAAPERQPGQTASDLPGKSSEAKTTVYEKGATVTARFAGAEMVVDSPGGMDLARIEDYPSLYTGSIAAILPDGAKVDADCPLKTLRTLRGYSKVHAGKPTHGGLPLQTTNMAAEQEGNPQQVVLLYNGQKWRVTDVVK